MIEHTRPAGVEALRETRRIWGDPPRREDGSLDEDGSGDREIEHLFGPSAPEWVAAEGPAFTLSLPPASPDNARIISWADPRPISPRAALIAWERSVMEFDLLKHGESEIVTLPFAPRTDGRRAWVLPLRSYGEGPIEDRDDSDRYFETAVRFARVLDASFALCDHVGAGLDPAIRDPRSRAWGATYYGPALVEELGRERVLNAPARRVWPEPGKGGVWLLLDELPFCPGEAKERRRAEVEEYLGLRERFGAT